MAIKSSEFTDLLSSEANRSTDLSDTCGEIAVDSGVGGLSVPKNVLIVT